MIHVVHGGRPERLLLVDQQMKNQGIDYVIWQGIHDTKSVVRSINLSHKQIVRFAKEHNLPEITIAEDDVLFTHPQSYCRYIYEFPGEYDIYLGGIYLGDIDRNNEVDNFCALHFYTVHSRFFDTYLNLPEDEHLDRLMSGKGKFVVCNPFVAIQHDGLFSSNTGKKENYEYLLRNYKLFKG